MEIETRQEPHQFHLRNERAKCSTKLSLKAIKLADLEDIPSKITSMVTSYWGKTPLH